MGTSGNTWFITDKNELYSTGYGAWLEKNQINTTSVIPIKRMNHIIDYWEYNSTRYLLENGNLHCIE